MGTAPAGRCVSLKEKMNRTRIKICGLTREVDVQSVVDAGADAVGFVFYAKSPRYVTPDRAAQLVALLPPFVAAVGLFVNEVPEVVAQTAETARLSLLQFHGDESPEQCHAAAVAAGLPFIRAFRVKPDTTTADLIKYNDVYRNASPLFRGLLLDVWSEAYGGAGKVFDWSIVSEETARQVVLSGGLNVQNVTGAVRQLRPFAVDVSSGVEASKGIKDMGKIRAFIDAVRQGDCQLD